MRAGMLILLPCYAAFSGLAGVPAPRLRRASSPLLQDVTRPARGDRAGVPRIGELRTVRQVVGAHAEHGKQYGPKDLGASWNTLGKLVRQQQSEKRVLRDAPDML